MATFVLIPGAGGDAWYWHLLTPELIERGHDVVVVELPADDDTAGLADYVDVVIDAIGDRRDRTDLVLVAQSLGGFTAPLVAARVPVELIVLVTAMIPAPGEPAGAWWTNTGQDRAMAEHAARHRTPATLDTPGDIEAIFFHDVPPDVTAVAMKGGKDQSGTPMEKPWPLPAWPDVPTKFLLCRDDRLFPAEFMRRVVRERLGISPDEIDGGHLVALSRPKELAERLDTYVSEVSRQ
ncbi:MAG TPA: alpha/beta hydrolase [Ilumatobacteraceae bacterium]|nr:alpha/beta hydrolase [Ilumatobacteraceae bacterium]